MTTPDVIIKTKGISEIVVTGVNVLLLPRVIASGPPGPVSGDATSFEQSLITALIFG